MTQEMIVFPGSFFGFWILYGWTTWSFIWTWLAWWKSIRESKS